MNGSLVGRQIGGLLGDGEVPKEFTVYEYVTAGKNQLKSVTSILIEEVLEVPWIELDRSGKFSGTLEIRTPAERNINTIKCLHSGP